MADERKKYAKHLTFMDTLKAQMQPIISPDFSGQYALPGQQEGAYLDVKAIVRAGDAGALTDPYELSKYKSLKAQGY